MSRPARLARTALALAALAGATATASAQGLVQERDPRRPPLPEASSGCQLWRGLGSGNDPSAETYVQLCTDGARVTGTFLWSSLTSGWDRRALEGAWTADGTRLEMRDVRMLESHPLSGWQLCAADRYDLRLVSPTRLEGTYDSRACSDHGRLTVDLVSAAPAPVAAAPPSVPPRLPVADAADPAARARLAMACGAAPGAATSTAPLAALAALALAAGVASGRRRRRAP